jgi:hypothetical protein
MRPTLAPKAIPGQKSSYSSTLPPAKAAVFRSRSRSHLFPHALRDECQCALVLGQVCGHFAGWAFFVIQNHFAFGLDSSFRNRVRNTVEIAIIEIEAVVKHVDKFQDIIENPIYFFCSQHTVLWERILLHYSTHSAAERLQPLRPIPAQPYPVKLTDFFGRHQIPHPGIRSLYRSTWISCYIEQESIDLFILALGFSLDSLHLMKNTSVLPRLNVGSFKTTVSPMNL